MNKLIGNALVFIKKNLVWVITIAALIIIIPMLIGYIFSGNSPVDKTIEILKSENAVTREVLNYKINDLGDIRKSKDLVVEENVPEVETLDIHKKTNILYKKKVVIVPQGIKPRTQKTDKSVIKHKGREIKKDDPKGKIWNFTLSLKNDFDNYRIIDVAEREKVDEIIGDYKILDEKNVVIIDKFELKVKEKDRKYRKLNLKYKVVKVVFIGVLLIAAAKLLLSKK